MVELGFLIQSRKTVFGIPEMPLVPSAQFQHREPTVRTEQAAVVLLGCRQQTLGCHMGNLIPNLYPKNTAFLQIS